MVSGTIHSSTVARRVDVPAKGNKENATLPSGQLTSRVNGGVGTKKSIVVEIESEDEKSLIYDWLSRLLTLVDIENMFFSKFEVIELKKDDEFKLKVKCSGEEIRQELILTIAKAVTYYKYSVERTKDGWVASVVLDV